MSKTRKREKEEFRDSFSDEGVVELPIPDPINFYKKPKKPIPPRNKKPIELKRQKN
jgi:hypothetical protein